MFRLCSSQKHGCRPKERLPLVPIRDGPCLFCRRLVLAVCGDLKVSLRIVTCEREVLVGAQRVKAYGYEATRPAHRPANLQHEQKLKKHTVGVMRDGRASNIVKMDLGPESATERRTSARATTLCASAPPGPTASVRQLPPRRLTRAARRTARPWAPTAAARPSWSCRAMACLAEALTASICRSSLS